MNNRIITKKRKYLVIQLVCASSSNWSSMYSSRGCGCNNGIDVLIILPFLKWSRPRRKLIFLTQIRLQICNVKSWLTPKSAGSSSLYALSFIFSNTLKGLSARGISLDLRKLGNLSWRKCNQTKSPGWCGASQGHPHGPTIVSSSAYRTHDSITCKSPWNRGDISPLTIPLRRTWSMATTSYGYLAHTQVQWRS